MQWQDTELPWWQDGGKLVEVETEAGALKGRLVIVDQTPGPDECPIFVVETNGTQRPFDPGRRWRFVEA